jgi:hypothetical protein
MPLRHLQQMAQPILSIGEKVKKNKKKYSENRGPIYFNLFQCRFEYSSFHWQRSFGEDSSSSYGMDDFNKRLRTLRPLFGVELKAVIPLFEVYEHNRLPTTLEILLLADSMPFNNTCTSRTKFNSSTQ